MNFLHEFTSFLVEEWQNIGAILGIFASIIALCTYFYTLFKPKKVIPSYVGEINDDFSEFVLSNSESIFKLEIYLTGNKNQEFWDCFKEGNNEKDITITVENLADYEEFDEKPISAGGIIYSFMKDDPNLHWHTRIISEVSTKGYFKVNGMDGTYQGWNLINLKAVGIEHINYEN